MLPGCMLGQLVITRLIGQHQSDLATCLGCLARLAWGQTLFPVSPDHRDRQITWAPADGILRLSVPLFLVPRNRYLKAQPQVCGALSKCRSRRTSSRYLTSLTGSRCPT